MHSDFGTSNKRARLARVSAATSFGNRSPDEAAPRDSSIAYTPGANERDASVDPPRHSVPPTAFETPKKAVEAAEAIPTVRTKMAVTPGDAVTPGGSRVSAARTPSSAFSQSFTEFTPGEEKKGKEWMEEFRNHMAFIDKQRPC